MCLALKPHVSASISTSIILRCSSTWADPVPLSAARLCDFKMVTTRGRSWPPQVQGDLETRPRAAQHHGSRFWGGGDRTSSRREVPLYCGHPQWRWPPEPMRGGICTHRWGLTPDLWSVHNCLVLEICENSLTYISWKNYHRLTTHFIQVLQPWHRGKQHNENRKTQT